MRDSRDPVVWSSDGPPDAVPGTPRGGAAQPTPPAGAVAKVRLERQGRGGKVVSVVDGLTGHPARIEEIARALKVRCGAGGTTRGKTVEIQGDHRDRIVEALAGLGVPAKRAGG